MKKLVFKLLLFTPFLLFLAYLEYNLSYLQNSYTYKRECLEKQLDSIEVLVLGSSQAAYGVNPVYFNKKGYNLANISQTLFYDTRLTLKYVDKMPNLKHVIITISYFSFGEQIHDGVEPWRDYCYYQFWDIKYPDIKNTDLGKYSKIFLYTPKLSFIFFLNQFKVNLIEGYQPNGYLFHDTINNPMSISDELGYQRVKSHENAYKENRFAGNKADLELLVTELKKRNIEVAIITPPVYKTYSKFVDFEKLQRNQKTVFDICEKFHCCKYFNFFTDERFVKSDFYDNDHLNFMGAAKFSKIINDEILEKP